MEDQERLAETPFGLRKSLSEVMDRTTLKGLNPDVRSPARTGRNQRENQGIVKKMNRRKEDGKCTVCGSTRRVEGETHYLCDGAAPTRGARTRSRLLTRWADSNYPEELKRPQPTREHDRALFRQSLEKLRKNHITTSYKKPRFIDIAISELVRKFGVCKVSEDAARLLIEVDTKESLGGIRKKRHGTKGMGKEESKEYRARAFAAAAAYLNSNGQSNTAPQVERLGFGLLDWHRPSGCSGVTSRD